MHVGFKLSDTFRRKCVGDGLALSGVFCAVTRVKEAALD